MFAVIVVSTSLQLVGLCQSTVLFGLCFYFRSEFGSLLWGRLSPAIFVFLITIPDISSPENNRRSLWPTLTFSVSRFSANCSPRNDLASSWRRVIQWTRMQTLEVRSSLPLAVGG